MAYLTNSLWPDLLVGISSLIILTALFFIERYKYWKVRGVPYVKPKLLFGSLKENLLGKENLFQTYCKMYEKLGEERFGGFFEIHIPNLMIKDPDLIYRILVKDFAHFHDRAWFPVDRVHDPLTNSLVSLTGHEWRTLRYKLSPTFTSGKLKGMLQQIYNSGEHLLAHMEELANTQRAIDCRDLLSEFTIDVIASCAFGLQFQLDSPQGRKFKTMVYSAFPTSRFTTLTMLMRVMFTKVSYFLGLRSFTKEVTEYFLSLSRETVKYRREKGIKRVDFLQLLIDLKESEDMNATEDSEITEVDDVVNQLKSSSVYSKDLLNEKVMTEECLAASSFIFLVAGSEVSGVMTFALYSLATNRGIQEKLQQEIDRVLKKHKTLSYEALKDMVYLDKVLSETLRMFPIGAFISRVCTIPYRIPDTDVILEKGSRVTIPVWAIHYDPKYYPEPEIFDPERFPEPNYKPSPTYFPFGDGPRICIAMRFAILEMKVCIARVMSQYTVSLSNETKLPLQFVPDGLIPRVQGGIKILVAKRKLNQAQC